MANQLGTDAYGMKSYWLVLLKTGWYQSTDILEISQAFKGHMQHIEALAAQGTLIVAGPLEKTNVNYGGFIFWLFKVKKRQKLVC